MTQPNTTHETTPKPRFRTRSDLPAPLYAAAGAGEVAYEKLRKLPEATARTLKTAGESAGTLRRRFAEGERDLTAEFNQAREQFRETARRQAGLLAAHAASAQEKAVTGYRKLVARGERVVSERFGVATGQAEPPTRVEAVVERPAGPAAPAAVTSTPEAAAATAPRPTTRTAKPAGQARPAGRPKTRGVAESGIKAPGEHPAA